MASRGQGLGVRHQRAQAFLPQAGRFGADRGRPGIHLALIHPIGLTLAIARKGKGKAIAEALASWRGAEARWAGPDQTYVLGKGFEEARERLEGIASCTDQSHGRVMLGVSGPKAKALLAKGTPIDLDLFPVGQSAVTQMAHVSIHLTRTGADAFELSVFRGFSESFWEWLTGQAQEFGYQTA